MPAIHRPTLTVESGTSVQIRAKIGLILARIWRESVPESVPNLTSKRQVEQGITPSQLSSKAGLSRRTFGVSHGTPTRPDPTRPTKGYVSRPSHELLTRIFSENPCYRKCCRNLIYSRVETQVSRLSTDRTRKTTKGESQCVESTKIFSPSSTPSKG